jgi:hypothetical protein
MNVFNKVTNPESACSGATNFLKLSSSLSDYAAFREFLGK